MPIVLIAILSTLITCSSYASTIREIRDAEDRYRIKAKIEQVQINLNIRSHLQSAKPGRESTLMLGVHFKPIEGLRIGSSLNSGHNLGSENYLNGLHYESSHVNVSSDISYTSKHLRIIANYSTDRFSMYGTTGRSIYSAQYSTVSLDSVLRINSQISLQARVSQLRQENIFDQYRETNFDYLYLNYSVII